MERRRTPEEELQRVKETINKGTRRDLDSLSEQELLQIVDKRLKRVARTERQRERQVIARAENNAIEAKNYKRVLAQNKISNLTFLYPGGNPFNAGWSERQPSPEERTQALTQAVEEFFELEPEETAEIITHKISSIRRNLEDAREDLPAAELQWDLWEAYAKVNPGRRPTRDVFVANALRERLNNGSITESQYTYFAQSISGDRDKATLSPPRYYRFRIEHGLALLETLVDLQERFVPFVQTESVTQQHKTTPGPTIENVRARAFETAHQETQDSEPSDSSEPTATQSTGLFDKIIKWFRT